MLAIDWELVIRVCVVLLVTALAIYGIRLTRKVRTIALRVVGVSLCAILALLGSLLSVLFLAASGCDRHSSLIYSPSRDVAARTNDFDYGATGGDTSVTLHWAWGMRTQTVYFGEWRSVEPQDIQWKSNSTLTIYYDARSAGDERSCSSTPHVRVMCVPRDSRFSAP
jgi:hypothetical protein